MAVSLGLVRFGTFDVTRDAEWKVNGRNFEKYSVRMYLIVSYNRRVHVVSDALALSFA
eukprot:SAG31_NODE_8229_length_1493_cov_1.564562_2_plen_57_part_01